ncbi:ABC-type glycerol-3-phosphate transport system substrate-binding protein [Anaerobacterium chartisolvens]|uniref:ABC-type glycerol-3-phosphate transport system substrate-binding protein n=1 Tax=Anaerobacterium chartisolvens TaxID=1297424 RepID=A0A369B342_9FIRM|nr:extracellular solute-binding protein [Anaerobacterium chartisolvens]RCX16032.1 ABC-type glycerol-3-phosphate transport system substrate-binding protein [Anaerobacterium chartisolvens]
MKIRSFVCILLLAIMFFSSLTGCAPYGIAFFNNAPNQGDKYFSKSDIKIVLNYYTWIAAEKDNPIFKQFSDLNPNIEIKVNLLPDSPSNIQARLDILALGGGEMDIWPFDGAQLTEIKRGLVKKIDEFIERDGIDMEKWFGASAASVYFNGSYYGLPYRSSVPMVFYNKDMFDEAGVPYPTDEWTYDDLYRIAGRVTKGGNNIGDRKVFGFMQNWFLIAGGRPGSSTIPFYGPDGLSCFSSQPYWEKTLSLRKKMQDEGIEMPYEYVRSRDTTSSIEFLSGRTAMTYGASWAIRDMKDKKSFPVPINVGCVLPPIIDKSAENIPQISVVESMLGIPETSKYPEEAWRFIKFYIENGSESIAKNGDVPLYLPAYSDSLIETFIEGSGLTFEDGKKFFPDKYRYDFIPRGTASSEYVDIIRKESEKYLTEQQTLEQAMENIKIKADKAIVKEKNFLKYKTTDS